MNLTADQEAKIVSDFYDVLRQISSRFYYVYNRRLNRRFDQDDCFQEILMVFLRHIRRVDAMEHICPLPFRDFKNAVCVLVMGGLPLSVPRRTSDFGRMTKEIKEAGSVDEMKDSGIDFDGGLDPGYVEAEEKLALEQFMTLLPQQDREFLSVFSACDTASQAAAVMGVHQSTVGRKLAALKFKYRSECA